ncbi:MAG: YdcF family protein [Clostridiales bacterium]|nr:YdcF family protein [Clostridiales bacterium]
MSYYSSRRSRPSVPRRVIGDLLIALTVIFTIWLSVIMVQRILSVVLVESYAMMFVAELAICLIFLLFSIDVRTGFLSKAESVVVKTLAWLLRIVLILSCGLVLFTLGKIIIHANTHDTPTAQNAIVLGLALQNGKPTDDLISRIETARQFSESNPDAKLILTGGNADVTGKTEAVIMQELLTEKGVAEDRMILEDKATSTKENFANVAGLIDPAAPVVIITSDYHMDRASIIANSAGFKSVLCDPAPSKLIEYPANIMWEIVNELADTPTYIQSLFTYKDTVVRSGCLSITTYSKHI